MHGGDSRYELLELIGSGGMAEVYRARMIGAVGFEKQVAIKQLLPHVSSDEEFVQRFIDEARLTARLVHPNICQILDFGVMDDCYFLAMEYVDGLDLSALLKGAAKENERIPVDVALYVICGVLRGLKHAHEATDEANRPLGIVHRDVSPQNVLLSVNGDIKLSDLGAATANEAYRSTRTQKHFRLGKVLYMAPEQRRSKQVDARADIYSTGILLAEMLLGQDDFHQNANMFLAGMCCLWDKVSEQINSPLGQALARIIERTLAEDPARRFQTADELHATLEALLLEYAPGTSVDRVSRLVQRLKRKKKGRQKEEAPPAAPESKREITSIVSLHTGDLAPITASSGAQRNDEKTTNDLPDLQPQGGEEEGEEPTGLADAITTVAHSGQLPHFASALEQGLSDPDIADYEPHEGRYDFENEATVVRRAHHSAPGAVDQAPPGLNMPHPQQGIGVGTPPYEEIKISRPDPQGPAEQAPPRAEPSVIISDPPAGLSEPPTMRGRRAPNSAPSGSWPVAPLPDHRRRRKFPLLVVVIVVVAVLIAGLAFGGLLAGQLFPVVGDLGEDSSPPPPQKLITATPSPTAPTPAITVPEPSAPEVAPTPGAPTQPDDAPPEAVAAPELPRPEPASPEQEPRSSTKSSSRSERPSRQSHEGYGFLNINSRPFGIPYVDGQPIPSGTPVANYRVKSGRHVVIVRFPHNDQTARRVVKVYSGQTRGITVTPDR